MLRRETSRGAAQQGNKYSNSQLLCSKFWASGSNCEKVIIKLLFPDLIPGQALQVQRNSIGCDIRSKANNDGDQILVEGMFVPALLCPRFPEVDVQSERDIHINKGYTHYKRKWILSSFDGAALLVLFHRELTRQNAAAKLIYHCHGSK